MVAQALTASLEDYLEAIFVIASEKKVARVKEIAKRLGVHKSTVTAALHALADRHLVNYVPYEVITLTSEGKRIGKEMARRHEALRGFLTRVLGIDEETAGDTACKMEHVIPAKVMTRFSAFAEFIELCPRAGAQWIRGFGYFCEDGPEHGNCERCIKLTLDEAKRRRPKDGRARGGGTLPLSQLRTGEGGRLVELRVVGDALRRFTEMGITPGSAIEMVRVGPFGEVFEIKVRGYNLSVRGEDAAQVIVSAMNGNEGTPKETSKECDQTN